MKTLIILTAIFIAAIETASQLPILRPSVVRCPQLVMSGRDKRTLRRKADKQG
jgi:hypothetical protein